MRTMTRALAALLALGASGALAQTTTAPRDPNMPPPQSVPPEKIRPEEPSSTGSSSGGETLSDRLQRTEGVIPPPSNATPDMRVRPPVPDPNSTPVIRPPGAPGDTVQPK